MLNLPIPDLYRFPCKKCQDFPGLYGCPDDGLAENEWHFSLWARVRTNYVVNWGNTGYAQKSHSGLTFGGAPFTFRQSKRLADIRDGTANTLMLSETLTPKGKGWEGPLGETSLSTCGQSFDAWVTPNSPVPDEVGRRCPNPATKGGTICITTSGGVIYAYIPATHHHAARSFHTGGVNAAFCDGSVRFVSNHIDLAVWRALSTANGREVIDHRGNSDLMPQVSSKEWRQPKTAAKNGTGPVLAR